MPPKIIAQVAGSGTTWSSNATLTRSRLVDPLKFVLVPSNVKSPP